jgi:hypothetical protein
MACSAILAPEDTPLAIGMKKMDKKCAVVWKYILNIAYYIAKRNNPFSYFKSMLELNAKSAVAVREEYSNKNWCKNFVLCI